MRIDATDEKIMAYLDNDARTPNTKIAKALRLNKNVVNYRIKNLEENGIIQYYYTLIDTYRLGYQGYRLYLKLHFADKAQEAEMMKYLMGQESAWLTSYIKGSWDMVAIFWVKTQAELITVVNAFISRYRQFIERHQLVVYYGIGHYRWPFTKRLLKQKAHFDYLRIDKTVNVDRMDLRLLRFLSVNARAPLSEMAQTLRISPGAVRYRIKNLLKQGVVRGFRPRFDSRKLGYVLYKIDIQVNEGEAIERLYRFAREHDNIYYMNHTLGYADVEIEAQVRSPQELFDVLGEIQEAFARNIRNYDFFIVEETGKLKYLPDSDYPPANP